MGKAFQRKGAVSNAHVGREFEGTAREFFAKEGLDLEPNLSVAIGVKGQKPHAFDLGDRERMVLVECKSHTWTESGNVPSAKMTAWNEAMYLFLVAPARYRKILFVLRDFSPRHSETLAEYYVRTYSHLIPAGVEIWEYDEERGRAERVEYEGPSNSNQTPTGGAAY
jgi:hypothetical protein